MKESPAAKSFKYRKSSPVIYPSVQPKVPNAIEVLYHSFNHDSLERETSAYRERIVTIQTCYKPAILAVVRLTFQGTRWEIHHERDVTRAIPFPTANMTEWDTNLAISWDNKEGRMSPEEPCLYLINESFDFSEEHFESLQDELIQHLISTETLEIQYNPYLKLRREFGETEEDFFSRCLEKVHESFEQEMRTLEETVQRQEERLKERLGREIKELGKDPEGLGEKGKASDLDFSEVAVAVAPERTTSEDKQVEMKKKESIVNINDIKRQLGEMEHLKDVKLKEFEANLSGLAGQHEEDILRLSRHDVRVLRFSLLWLPYSEVITESDTGTREILLIRSF